MLDNASMPAMPMPTTERGQVWTATDLGGGFAKQCRPAFGLTKREMLAMHFHAALLAKESSGSLPHYIAVREADALLEALEATNPAGE